MKKPRRHRIFKVFSVIYYIGSYLMVLDLDSILMSTLAYLLFFPVIFIIWFIVRAGVYDEGKPGSPFFRWLNGLP
ncbi:MAG: hypothetical protein K2J65_11115 [Duncaniella sp.]|nr:hypothetical protein [Duncaniella sp.]